MTLLPPSSHRDTRLQVPQRLDGDEASHQLVKQTGRIASWEWKASTGEFECDEDILSIYGRSPHELRARDHVLSFVHSDDRERVRGEIAATLTGTVKSYQSDFRVLWPDGSQRWIAAFGRPVLNDGEVTRLVGVSIDITERKQGEAALIQHSKLEAVSKFASSLAHELNNPLEAVTNLLYLARHSRSLEEVRDYLDSAELELKRTCAVANKILHRPKQDDQVSEVTSSDLIIGVLAVHLSRLINSNVTVEKRIRACAPITCFDGQIRQMLNQLVGNAIDALSKGGRLILRARGGSDWKTGRQGLLITVADNGTGMSPTTLLRKSEAFFTTKNLCGLGIGLWLCQDIVDWHEGLMSVRSSEASGRCGTVFRVFIPRKNTE